MRHGSKALRWTGAALALVLVAGACGDDDDGGAVSQPGSVEEPVVIAAGINDPADPNIAVLEYLPESVTVPAGTNVTWEFAGPEPHSVTFLAAGTEAPAPGTPEGDALNAPDLPTGPYDGSATVSSGLRPTGPEPADPFEMAFAEPGEYRYFCSIHPQMTGTVTVVGEGEGGDDPADITARAETERDRWLAEGRAAKAALLAAPVRSETGEDGATTWYVEMGTTTEHTDVLAFQPMDLDVASGDRVTFVNNSGAPHTATFGPSDQLPANPESEEAMEASPGPSPQQVAAGAVMNTGWLPPDSPPGSGPPEAARSFTVTFAGSGDYPYVCLLHAPSAMVGEISVG